MYALTIFKNVFDNKTHKRMDFPTWDLFEQTLYDLSGCKFKEKKDAYLISPAIYEPDTTRANKNVVSWAGWAAVDVDEHEFKGNLQEELKEKYGQYYYVCYSTASSSVDYPKFRLVFPLGKRVENAKIKHFWFALNSELDDLADKQTKDLSRMYYIPGDYSGSNNFIFTNKGDFIDPDSLMAKYPYVEKKTGNSFLDQLPEELQKQVIEHRKTKLPNKEKYKWTNLHDCPFVNKSMLQEYRGISETGWYHKMYQFMVSLAFNAIRLGYPITDVEIEQLTRQLDLETGNWYEKRPIRAEANQALNYAYKNSEVL
jgi:hypothetical protein